MTEMYVKVCHPHRICFDKTYVFSSQGHPRDWDPPCAITVKASVISQKQQDIPVLFCVVFDALHCICCPALGVQPLIRAYASLVSCHHFSMLSLVSDMNLVLILVFQNRGQNKQRRSRGVRSTKRTLALFQFRDYPFQIKL